jgi:hypothetical protein
VLLRSAYTPRTRTQSLAFGGLVDLNCVPVSFEFVVLGVEVLHRLVIRDTVVLNRVFLTTFKDHVSSQTGPPVSKLDCREDVARHDYQDNEREVHVKVEEEVNAGLCQDTWA